MNPRTKCHFPKKWIRFPIIIRIELAHSEALILGKSKSSFFVCLSFLLQLRLCHDLCAQPLHKAGKCSGQRWNNTLPLVGCLVQLFSCRDAEFSTSVWRLKAADSYWGCSWVVRYEARHPNHNLTAFSFFKVKNHNHWTDSILIWRGLPYSRGFPWQISILQNGSGCEAPSTLGTAEKTSIVLLVPVAIYIL